MFGVISYAVYFLGSLVLSLSVFNDRKVNAVFFFCVGFDSMMVVYVCKTLDEYSPYDVIISFPWF